MHVRDANPERDRGSMDLSTVMIGGLFLAAFGGAAISGTVDSAVSRVEKLVIMAPEELQEISFSTQSGVECRGLSLDGMNAILSTVECDWSSVEP